MIGKTEALVLYMVSEGIDTFEKLKETVPISDEELDNILKKLENEGYLDNSEEIKLTKKGFETLMNKEVVEMIGEMKMYVERLASVEYDEENVNFELKSSITEKVAEAKDFLQRLAEEEAKIANINPSNIGKTEIVVLYLISEGVRHSIDIKAILPISGEELDRVIEVLEQEGYLESKDGLKLTKKGFDLLIEHSGEVKHYVEDYLKKKISRINEVRRLVEKLSSVEVEVKEGIRYYLTPEEEVLAKCKDRTTGYEFYATNARILKYKATEKGEDFAEIPYSVIEGVALSSSRDMRLLGFGGIAVILGLLVGGAGLLLSLLGMGAVGLYVYRSTVFYEFVGSGALEKKKIAKKWRIFDTENVEVQNFVRTIREIVSRRKMKGNQYNVS